MCWGFEYLVCINSSIRGRLLFIHEISTKYKETKYLPKPITVGLLQNINNRKQNNLNILNIKNILIS